MCMRPPIMTFAIGLVALFLATPLHGQLPKKLKKVAQQAVEDELTNQVDRLLRNAIRCTLDDVTCYQDAKDDDKEVTSSMRTARSSPMTDLSSDPGVTTPAEAGTAKEHVRFILQLVPQAAHWAIISEIYHDSPDARKAFEGSIAVLQEGDQLFAEAGRCYMEL